MPPLNLTKDEMYMLLSVLDSLADKWDTFNPELVSIHHKLTDLHGFEGRVFEERETG